MADIEHNFRGAEIWKEYGAIAYFEYVGEDLTLEGTRSFIKTVEAKEDEVLDNIVDMLFSPKFQDLLQHSTPQEIDNNIQAFLA